MDMYDHQGQRASRHFARVNGIKMHYAIAGEGAPLLLLHGTPKTNVYWSRVLPLLTKDFTVIAPDLRGFGYTDKPGATEGYDSVTMTTDVDELMSSLGFDDFYIHGEDRGAEYGFVYAARFPEKVRAMSFGEMAVSGFGIEEAGYFTERNVRGEYNRTGKWLWHVPFFFVQNIPEMLLAGKESEFWHFLLAASAYDPTKLDQEILDEWSRHYVAPGGIRGILETYRAELVNIRTNEKILETQGKLSLPVVTQGGVEFYGYTVKGYAERIFSNIKESVVFEECGHHLAMEQPEKLATSILSLKKYA